MRLRKDDPNGAIAAKSCPAIRRVADGQPSAAIDSLHVQQPQGVPMKAGTLEEFGTLKAIAALHVLIVAHPRNDAELILLEPQEPGLRFQSPLAEKCRLFR